MRATIQFLMLEGKVYTNKSELARLAGCSRHTINNILQGSANPDKYNIEIIEGIEFHGLWFCEDGEVRKTIGKTMRKYGRFNNLISTSRLKGYNGTLSSVGVANVIYHLFRDDDFNPFNSLHRINFKGGASNCSLDSIEAMPETNALIKDTMPDVDFFNMI